jgi:mRNA interferase MazF
MRQGEIWKANLNPIEGSEQAGCRPVVIVSGNLANTYAPVVVCCPLTTKLKNYKGNPILEPSEKNGLSSTSEILVIHLRSLSKSRLIEKLGEVSPKVILELKQTINDLLNY